MQLRLKLIVESVVDENSFCKVNFVYICDMSRDIERIRTPILSLPIIAYLQDC